MRILGLVGSRRERGNTELLVKEALMGARELGAEVQLLRLTDLLIEPCRGCLACIFKQVKCPLEDDLYYLLERMQQADGLVLGAPIYFGGAPGIIKLIVDRFLTIQPGQFEGKRAVTLGVGSKIAWAREFQEQLNLLPLMANYEIVNHALFSAPGPGEVLLDQANPRRANEMGKSLLAALNGKGHDPEWTSDHCPICWGKNFRLLATDRVECPTCFIQGNIISSDGNVAIRFERETLKYRFFGHASRAEHSAEWIEQTAPHFKQHVREVLAARRRYDDAAIPWLKRSREG